MKKTIETRCGVCERITHQQPQHTKSVVINEEYDSTIVHFMIVECGGCKTVSFLLREPDPTALPDEQQYIDYNYPAVPRYLDVSFTFLNEKDQDELPEKIYDLYEEVKTLFRKDTNIMAGMGLRMLVEAICLQQKINGKNLQEKIKKMHADGLISTSELPILDKLRLIGNQSAHEIKAFPIDKLSYALDIINHVIRSIYILPKINRKLKI